MKTSNLIIAGCLLATSTWAQYGQRTYSHPNMTLSSAKTTNLNSVGYVTAGYQPSSTLSQPNFIIDKTDIDGDFTLPTDFAREYNIYDSPNCNGGLSAILNCAGVSVLETNLPNGAAFVVTGGYTNGVFFAQLDANGQYIPSTYYSWQIPGSSKPAIIESRTMPGTFYICGIGPNSYAASIDYLTGPNWMVRYNSPQQLFARDLVESPYNPHELVIVGMANVGGAPADEAFFMRVDANNGTPINLFTYGDGNTGDEWFTSIKVARSTYGGSDGYIIGGRASTGSIPWMLKVNHAGNPIWSTLIIPSQTTNQVFEINDVFERNDPFGSGLAANQYYGIAGTTDGTDKMTVWRLDDAGSNGAFPSSQFIYPAGSGTHLWIQNSSVQLEAIGNGSNPGDGFGAWTTEPGGTFHFAKAYFNGVTGCGDDIWINKLLPGYNITGNLSPNPIPVQSCHQGQLRGILVNASSPYCWQGTVPGGSNLKTAQVTGIQNINAAAQNAEVYPNPSNDKITISFNAEDNSQVKITVTNAIGQVVKMIALTKSSADRYEETIDLASLQLDAGVYLVNICVDGRNTMHKVIYQPTR